MIKNLLFIIIITLLLVKCGVPTNTKKTQNVEDLNFAIQLYQKALIAIDNKDDNNALHFATNSALLGYPDAQFLLGYMYDSGITGISNKKYAIKWYEKAAENHHFDAQINLNILQKPTIKIPVPYIGRTELKTPNSDEKFTIIVGKLMGQEYVPDIQPAECFKEGMICMSSYYLYKINIQQVLLGEPLKGIVKVVRYQHSEYMYRGSENAIFVIGRIKNKKTATLLKTDYFLAEHINPRTQYCFPENLDKYYPELKELYYFDCLPQEDVYGGLKDQLIDLAIQNIESKLRQKSILLHSDYDYSDGQTLLPESDDEDDLCPSYIDIEKYETDINCTALDDIETYKVRIYQVKKGKTELVKELILQELSNLKINLDNVKMNFQITKNRDNDTVYWHYIVEHLKD